MDTKKTILLFTVLVLLFLSLASPFTLAQETEVKYPTIAGDEGPTTVRTPLPGYIKYIFYFAIGVAGFIAFAAMVLGGIKYLTSVGNPSQMSDAQNQILAAFLGVILLLGSYILLNTINPQLTQLEISKCQLNAKECPQTGIVLCKGSSCSANPKGAPGVDFIALKSSVSCLVNCEAGGSGKGFDVGSIWYGNSSNELEVQLYRNRNWENIVWDSKEQGFIEANTPNIPVPGPVNSVKLTWKMPGIYLFAGKNCTGEARLYTNSLPSLRDFDNKPRSMYIVPRLGLTDYGDIRVEEKLGAILHEKQNPLIDGGNAMVVLGNKPGRAEGPTWTKEPFCTNLEDPCDNNYNTFCVPGHEIKGETSAITVFKQVTVPIKLPHPFIDFFGKDPKSWGDGVTIFGNYQYNEQDPRDRKEDEQIHCGPINLTNWPLGKSFSNVYPKPWLFDGSDEVGEPILYKGTDNESKLNCAKLLKDKKVSSIKVQGNFIAILYRSDGRGEVFFDDDPRLKDNYIGDNEARYLLVIPVQE